MYVGLLDDYVRRVAEVNEQFHGVLIDVPDSHLGLTRFLELSREHSSEIRRACRENDAVGEDLSTSDVEHHIAELSVTSENIELGERDFRVFLGDVGHPCRRARRAVQQDIHPLDGIIGERVNL